MDENYTGSGVGDLMVWAKAHAGGLPADRAEVRARALESGTYEGTAKHPFPVADRAEYLAAVRAEGIARRSLKAPVGRILLSAIKGIQETVNRERLTQHLKNPRLIPDGARAPGHGALIDLPIVVKRGGEIFIHDGHHRLCASYLRGDTSARVRYIDLDADADADAETPR